MNSRKHLYLSVITVSVLLFQLMSPAVASADNETPPSPSETVVETATPGATELPTEPIATETPTVEEATPTPAKPSSTPEPVTSPGEAAATHAPLMITESTVATDTPTEAVTLTPEAVETEATETPAESEQPTLPEALTQLPEDTSVVVLDEQGQILPLALQETADVIAQADPMWCPEGLPPGWPGCTTSYATMADLLTNAGAYINSQSVNGTIWITSGVVSDLAPVEIDGAMHTNWSNYSLTLQGGWSGLSGDMSIGSNSLFSVPITVSNWNSGINIYNIDAPLIALSNVNSVPGVTITNVNSDVELDTVTVNGSALNGIYVETTGKITGTNLTATSNSMQGAFLSGTTGVTLNGTNTFSGNGWAGLSAHSPGGAVTLNNVTATNTYWGYGVYITSGAGVTLTGANVFDNNTYGGLYAETPGDIILSNVSATNSLDGNGASLYSGGDLTLTGTNVFHSNGWSGLAGSHGGDLVLNNITANSNGWVGAFLYSTSGTGDVTLNGLNAFSGNANGGFSVFSSGNVTLNNVTADSNGASGGYVDNTGGTGNVTVNNGMFTDNLYHGIEIYTAGNITLANIISNAHSGTYGDGAYLDNTAGAGNVTLTGTNDFSNHSSGNSGMFILSNGDVTLSGLTSNNNGRGVNISQAHNVSITGSTFDNNLCECEGSGAYILASGDVSVGQSAFHANSLYVNSAGSVNINTILVDAAQGVGLGVETQGGDLTISNSRFTNTVPNYNLPIFPFGDGADVFPNGGNVTVTNSEFSGNEWGLWVADGNQLSITSSIFGDNTIDLSVWCALNSIGLSFPDNIALNIDIQRDCTYSMPVASSSDAPVTVTVEALTRNRVRPDTSSVRQPTYQGKSEFWLVCKGTRKDPDFDNFKVYLPNGDRVDIYCPVSGKATITRLDNTTLPKELPIGYTYASAFEVQIRQPVYPLQRDAETGDYVREPIPVIYGGGRIMASFVATPLQPGRRFTILYWDAASSRWIPLKDYIFGRKFMLFPENPNDERMIVIGVQRNTRNEQDRIEITTNFPGIFVLAQQ